MASLNDNLFTTLVNHASHREVGCRILTRWGPMIARFTENGLAELYFDDRSSKPGATDSVFRDVFLQWIARFEKLPAPEQWNYLAPKGTDFQHSVWRALLDVPIGKQASYQEIAKSIDRPKANRAVGSAVGANPISMLIPCHRIILASGKIGNYRWGTDRKLALLEAEKETGSKLLQLFK